MPIASKLPGRRGAKGQGQLPGPRSSRCRCRHQPLHGRCTAVWVWAVGTVACRQAIRGIRLRRAAGAPTSTRACRALRSAWGYRVALSAGRLCAMTSRGESKGATLLVAALVLVCGLPRRPTEHKEESPEETSVQTINPDVRNIARWAFPSAVSVAVIFASFIWWAGAMYAQSFYGFFSLRLHELGITYLDILDRSVPTIAVVLIVAASPLALSWGIGKLGRSNSKDSSRFTSNKSLLATLAAAGTSIVVATAILVGNVLQELGYRDADTISSTPIANYNTGALQSTFASPLVVAWISWTGTPNQSPLLTETSDKARSEAISEVDSTGATWNLVRLIGRNEGVTFYLNLADCIVYRAPTSLLVLRNPPLSFIPSEGSTPIPACPSRYPQ